VPFDGIFLWDSTDGRSDGSSGRETPGEGKMDTGREEWINEA
jgi:hypothetical protein